MSEVKGKPGPIQLDIGEKEAEGIYSNIAFISHSPSEFILDFARTLPGLRATKVFARILMTPQHAKALSLTLENNLSKYEAQFGPVKLPGKGTVTPVGFQTEEGKDKVN
jgi:hypothetical protein